MACWHRRVCGIPSDSKGDEAMTNNKILNLLKAVAVLLLLCGMTARPQAAHEDGTSGVTWGITLGSQTFENVLSICQRHVQQPLFGGSYVCSDRTLAGGPYLRIGSNRHSLMFAYRFSADYERTFTYTLTGQVRTLPFSFRSGSLAYQYRFHPGGTDAFEAFIKAGIHHTTFETDDSVLGEYTGEGAGGLWGAGVILGENFIIGYENADIKGEPGNGIAIYVGFEKSL